MPRTIEAIESVGPNGETVMDYNRLVSKCMTILLFSLAFLLAAPVAAQSLEADRLSPGSLDVRFQPLTSCQKRIQFSAEDEVWRVCARSQTGQPADQVCPTTFQLRCGQWVEMTLESMIQSHLTDPGRKTVLYVHGNRTDSEWSIARASQMYEAIFGLQGCSERSPIRFVIWQWTAETELPNPLKDFKVKAHRSVAAGRVFGQIVEALKAEPMLIIGYSLGAQVITSGLTSSVDGFALENKPKSNVPCHELVFIAPVFDEGYWRELCTAPGWLPIGATTSFRNPHDPALKLIANPTGRRGQFRNAFSWLSERPDLFGATRIVDLGSELRDKHAIVEYSSSPTLQEFIRGRACSVLQFPE